MAGLDKAETHSNGNGSAATAAAAAAAAKKAEDIRTQAPATDYAGRLTIVAALVLPQLALLAAGQHSGAAQLSAWYAATAANASSFPASPEILLGLLMFLPERFLYTFVWVAPKKYTEVLSKLGDGPLYEPIEFLFSGFVICKALQIGAFVQLYFRCGAPPMWDGYASLWQVVTGLSLVTVGQVLNTWIYLAIGKKGVYYGCRLGAEIPWVSGRPFSLCPYHPQYVGAFMTVLGGCIGCATLQHCEKGWFALCAGQLVSYVYMGAVEQYL